MSMQPCCFPLGVVWVLGWVALTVLAAGLGRMCLRVFDDDLDLFVGGVGHGVE